MKRKLNFDILESLRGLAALYVCIGHSRANLWIGGEKYLELHPRSTLGISDYLLLGMNMLTRLSTEFVIVFFVLSGFSIAHSLRKNKEAAPFYKRRFIRLYPPYVTALLWAMLVLGIIRWIMPQLADGTYATANLDRLKESGQLYNWKVILQNLIYLPQLDGILRPFWSLTMEVIFYLLAPYAFRNKKAYFISSIILFLVAMGGTLFQWKFNTIIHNFMYFNIFFAIGVALYDNFDRALEQLKIFTTHWAPLVATGIFFSMIWVSLVITDETIPSFMAAAMSMILIIYLLSRNLQVKWLIGVGRFSYTLYITHLPTVFLYMMLYFLITPAEPPYIYSSLVFIPCVFFCLLIAYLQYLLVEKRSKMVLDRLRGNRGKEKVVEKVAAF